MIQRSIVSSVVSAVLLLLSHSGCSEPSEFDAVVLTREALPVVEAYRDDPLFGMESTPPIELATLAEVEAALFLEIAPAVRRLESDPERAELTARRQARGLAGLIGAKYFPGDGIIRVVPVNIEQAVTRLGQPQSALTTVLRGLLLVECGHALVQTRYQASNAAERIRNADQSLAFRAVIEGFTLFIARRHADKHGWQASLEMCMRLVVGDDVDEESTDEYSEIREQQLFTYRQGERFIRRVFEAGGEPALRALFQDPPADTDLIAHPDWYLDPDSRPGGNFDLDGGLDELEAQFDPELWTGARFSSNQRRIEAQMALAGPEAVERIVEHFLEGRTGVVTFNEDPTRRNIAVQLKEHGSDEEASYFLDQVRILIDQSYPVPGVEQTGVRADWKGWVFQGENAEGSIKAALAAVGPLTVCVAVTGEEVSRERGIELLDRIVLKALARGSG